MALLIMVKPPSHQQVLPLLVAMLLLRAPPQRAQGTGTVRYIKWTVGYTDVGRLCKTKRIMTVNGEFPGPTVYVTEGDTVVVSVTNLAQDNITIHWHGIRQQLTCWSDGVAFITQCPIKPGETYTYRFHVDDQRGTLLWHAHKSWLRATLYGAFIILPKWAPITAAPHAHELPPLILGEWWIADVEHEVVQGALRSGGNHIPSDAITINGQPGALYNCSQSGMTTYEVQRGEAYLLRLINAAVNLQLFVGIANHTVTVLEADAQYTEPLDARVLVIAPGQTMALLLSGPDAAASDFLIAASPFAENGLFPGTPATALLRYTASSAATSSSPATATPSSSYGATSSPSSSTNTAASPQPPSLLPLPSLPLPNDSAFVFSFFRDSLCHQRASSTDANPGVPINPGYRFLYTLGYGMLPCPPHVPACFGPFNGLFSTAINNITFALPTSTSILQAYYYGIKGVYEEGFPDVPAVEYNFTGEGTLRDPATRRATLVRVVPYNSSVEVVLQNTRTLFQESHPVHLHGQNFWVVASGLGNFDAAVHTPSFNLLNPISRNTAVVPAGGWVAIRFRTLNPGVWFLHCHLDVHQMMGMAMAFIVLNGQKPGEILPPPPFTMPTCP